MLIIPFFFKKKRAIATGIAVCGSGAGTFVLAPFIEVVSCLHLNTRLTILFFFSFLISHGIIVKEVLVPFRARWNR